MAWVSLLRVGVRSPSRYQAEPRELHPVELGSSPVSAPSLSSSTVRVAEVPIAGRKLWKVLVPAAVILRLNEKQGGAENGTVYYHLGLAYEKANQLALARQQLERALEISPNNAYARKALTELEALAPLPRP